jgi:hypothetical protein
MAAGWLVPGSGRARIKPWPPPGDGSPGRSSPPVAGRIIKLISINKRVYHPGVVTYFAGQIPDDEWRQLLTYCLDRADSFAVHFPDGPGMLSYGRDDFPALSGVRVAPWAGMNESVEVTGPLTAESRRLFDQIETSMTTYEPERKLWDYRLFRHGDLVLQVGDFSDVLVTADDSELAALKASGISTDQWDLA